MVLPIGAKLIQPSLDSKQKKSAKKPDFMLNYYDGLGVREALRERFPVYSKTRDADLLRSEHIPFNMLAPLAGRPDLMRIVLREAFGLAMVRRKDIARFVSATLYPAGNKHFTHTLMKYHDLCGAPHK